MSAERQRPVESPLTRADLRAVDAALERLGDRTGPLQAAERLREVLPRPLAARAAELHALRGRAAGRLPGAAGGYFSRRGLQQATRVEVAIARARRLARWARDGWVLDATCGIGGDSLALASVGLRVVAMDRDPEAAQLARANLERAGARALVVIGDATAPGARCEWLVLDPDRRADGERSLDPERWSPPLSAALQLAARYRGACLKLAPAFDPERAALPREDVLLQWVSVDRELCEVALWTGEPAHAAEAPREVLALSTSGPAHAWGAAPCEARALEPAAARAIRFLCDPDPALVRSGLLGRLARDEGLAPLAPRCAYLGGDHPPRSGLLSCWRVLGVATADTKAVRRLLDERDVGEVVVRKRGHPEPAEVLARRWRGAGSRRGHLAVARLARGHAVYLLDDAPGAAAPRPPGN